MNLKTAQRQAAKMKMALQGPSGSGKTYSSLLLAYGMCQDWTQMAVIDTENGSANLYSSLGPFLVLKLDPPWSPERYIQAIDTCLKANITVIIIDGISPCWEFLLDFHSNLTGNSFTNWARVTPRQQSFVNAILQADSHMICTMRSKQDYVLNQINGKYIPEKVGLKPVQRDGIDYDFTIVFDIDINHRVIASKDRTGLFMDMAEYRSFIINPSTGNRIQKWCLIDHSSLEISIAATESIIELKALYALHAPLSAEIVDAFSERKIFLQNQFTSSNENGNGK